MKESRILNLEELEASKDWDLDECGDWYHKKEGVHIFKHMIGQPTKYWRTTPEMIAPQEQEEPQEPQEPQEGDMVEVWNGSEKPIYPEKRIFIVMLKSGKCLCVFFEYREKYLKGHGFKTISWDNYAPIPKPTAEEIAEKVGLSVEELRRVVNEA